MPIPTTIDAVQAALSTKQFSARELAQTALAAAVAENPKIQAFLTFSAERALAQADRMDALLAQGEKLPPLGGVPVAVKDVIVTAGLRTTCGSKILENYVPPNDATAVQRLEAAGAVIIGKTNCDEFAMGSSTENSGFFPTRNPRDLTRVPGGSSGGSAAAVAAGLCVAALGSDTGGSIRQPASFCGAVGMMGTYGRVSRFGLVAFASSLDHIGPLTNTVKDCATVMKTIAGRDPMDSTSAAVAVPDYPALLETGLKGVRIGVPREYFAEGLDAEVGGCVHAGIELLQKLGAEIRDIHLAHTAYAISAYYLIATAEASSNLARYDGVRYTMREMGSAANASTLAEMYRATRGAGFGQEVKRRIMLGTYALSAGYYDAYYLKAQKVRTLIARDFEEAFRNVDLIVSPVSPFPAFKLGEKAADPLEMYLSDIYTITASLAGIPGLSVPCGVTSAGLPVGMQMLSPHFSEARLLSAAHAFETGGGNTEVKNQKSKIKNQK
jgi:aspartyl-tRNA(Asn)/glutamyl-tRNA(Gln) amidotransferase subunit A